MELFVVLENGQVEINWESLELITSENFVGRIKFQLKDGCKIVKVVAESWRVQVFVSDKHVVGIFTFDKALDQQNCIWFNDIDLKEMITMIGGV